MEVLVFKTNIESMKKVKRLEEILNEHKSILNWSVDRNDIDNLLRIESINNLSESEVNGIIHQHGLYSEALKD